MHLVSGRCARQRAADTGRHGTPLDGVNYDSWGTVEGLSLASPFGFTGELQDPMTGLVSLRTRWYSTSHGTFTAYRWRSNESWDTIPYSHHGYAYGLSNPILYRDPTGKYPIDDWGDDPYCQDGSRRPPNGHCQYEELSSGAGTQLGGGAGGMPPNNEEYWDRLIHTRTELPDPIAVFVQDKGQPGQEIFVPTDLGPGIAIQLPTKLGDDRTITTCPDDLFPNYLTSKSSAPESRLDPRNIRYTQEAYQIWGPKPGGIYTVEGNIRWLKAHPDQDLPEGGPIRVFRKRKGMDDWGEDEKYGHTGDPKNLEDGQIYTLDNRRLVAYREAGRTSIPVVWVGDRDVRADRYKFSTLDKGLTIEPSGEIPKKYRDSNAG